MADEILECPINAFLDHYAPFKPSPGTVFTAFNDLKKKSRLEEVRDGDNNVWALADFATTDAFENTESVIFKPLAEIMHVLEEVKDSNGREPSFFYKDCMSTNMASEIDGTNFKVDACITSKLEDSGVTAIAEFKKTGNPEDIEDNRMKLISAAAQIMNEDPTRMWVYGITIEHTQMAVWYFCRSHSVKSKYFDFTTDVNTFIRVFLSLLYATRPEIGYDPTVTRVTHEGKICYVYEVGTDKKPRYYRTTELIFAARVLCITGRKTRVWEAIEVAGPKPRQIGREKPGAGRVVLKDGWLDENSPSEEETLNSIFRELDKIRPSDYQWTSGSRYLHQLLSGAFQGKKYKEYFMGILESRRLQKTKPRSGSAKPNSDIFSFAEPKPIGPLHTVGGTTQSGNHSGTSANIPSLTSQKKKKFRPREYMAKEQHRLIYSHVGCPLGKAKDLSSSFRAIHDTFIALVLLYLAGWTHRDVSPGNIIVVEKDGLAHGKLSDLEYAKEFTDTRFSADPKTGTPYFMPLEIHRGRPIYGHDHGFSSSMAEVNPFDPVSRHSENLDRQVVEAKPPMKFRFQHDLESLWWVALWILLYRVGGVKALDLAGRIFTYSDTPSDAREDFFIDDGDGLSLDIREELKPLVPTLLEIRAKLYNSYNSKEKTENLMDPVQYREIYLDVWARFTILIQGIMNVNGVDFQNPERPEQNAKTRPHSESEPGDDDEYTPQIPRRKRK